MRFWALFYLVTPRQLLVAQRFQRGDISSTVELPRAVRLPTPEQ
jgi:hypothetical protein